STASWKVSCARSAAIMTAAMSVSSPVASRTASRSASCWPALTWANAAFRAWPKVWAASWALGPSSFRICPPMRPPMAGTPPAAAASTLPGPSMEFTGILLPPSTPRTKFLGPAQPHVPLAATDLQGPQRHVPGGVESGYVGLVGPGGAEEVDHLLRQVHVGQQDKAVFIGVGMARIVNLLEGARVFVDAVHLHTGGCRHA